MHLLLVSPSGSYRTAEFLDAALALGCQVTVATDAEPAIAGTSIAVDLTDPHAAAERLLAMVVAIDAVVGTDGTAVAVAGEVARRLGLPTNPRGRSARRTGQGTSTTRRGGCEGAPTELRGHRG